MPESSDRGKKFFDLVGQKRQLYGGIDEEVIAASKSVTLRGCGGMVDATDLEN
jgi:hypothetical protein